MSLLLDALRTTESSTPAPVEPQEEPLDGHEILELLTAKSAANAPLMLESELESAAATAIAAPPRSDAALHDPTAAAREPAVALREPAIAARAAVSASSQSPATPFGPTARPIAAATLTPPSASRTLKYGVLFAVAAAIVGAAVLGKSLLRPTPTPIAYQEGGGNQPATAGTTHAVTPSTYPVRVPSTRPPDQFAYSGDAPEIALHDDETRPAHTPASSAARATRTARPTPTAPATPAAPMSAAPATAATLSITRSEGLASIDRHILAGYGALASGNVANARSEYLSALELDPNNVDAIMGTASAAAHDGNTVVAAAAYAKVLRLEPANPDATAALAMLRSGAATSESNESRLKTLIAADTDGRPALHTALGGVYAADARWAEAAQEYFTALSKEPGNPDLAFNVAASLDQNRNSAAALTYYEQALAFAKLRPAKIDVPAVEQRISQLKARLEVRASNVREAP
jgi:Flp pilus assembly protein TadD